MTRVPSSSRRRAVATIDCRAARTSAGRTEVSRSISSSRVSRPRSDRLESMPRQRLLVSGLERDGELAGLDCLEQRLQGPGLELGQVVEGEQRGADRLGEFGAGRRQRGEHRALVLTTGEAEHVGEQLRPGNRRDVGDEQRRDPAAQARVDLDDGVGVDRVQGGDPGGDLDADLLGQPGEHLGGGLARQVRERQRDDARRLLAEGFGGLRDVRLGEPGERLRALDLVGHDVPAFLPEGGDEQLAGVLAARVRAARSGPSGRGAARRGWCAPPRA